MVQRYAVRINYCILDLQVFLLQHLTLGLNGWLSNESLIMQIVAVLNRIQNVGVAVLVWWLLLLLCIFWVIPPYSVPGHIIKVILTKASFRGYSCRPSNLFVVSVLFPLCYPQLFSLMDLSFKSKARGAEREAFPIPNYISQSREWIPAVITTATCRIKANLN